MTKSNLNCRKFPFSLWPWVTIDITEGWPLRKWLHNFQALDQYELIDYRCNWWQKKETPKNTDQCTVFLESFFLYLYNVEHALVLACKLQRRLQEQAQTVEKVWLTLNIEFTKGCLFCLKTITYTNTPFLKHNDRSNTFCCS